MLVCLCSEENQKRTSNVCPSDKGRNHTLRSVLLPGIPTCLVAIDHDGFEPVVDLGSSPFELYGQRFLRLQGVLTYPLRVLGHFETGDSDTTRVCRLSWGVEAHSFRLIKGGDGFAG
jgi:hypothetical protein